jgi:DNA ligase-1
MKIKSIEKIQNEDRYDLEVEDNHNFFANDILVHNCRMVNVYYDTTSRNGETMVSCPHIGNALLPFFEAYPDGIIDGEIYAHNEYFEDVMSIVKKKKLTVEDLACSEQKAKLYIFDGILDDVGEGFLSRFERVKKAILETVKPEHMKYFVFVENEVVNSHEEIMTKHDEYVAGGYEGIMIRVIDSPYENKRSKYLLKYKSFFDNEFIILDVIEGEGNDSGKASKLNVQLKDGKTSECGIRGTDPYTIQLLKDRAKYIGKKATVRYQGFTKEGKLRFGVAVNIDPFDR